MKKSIKTIRDQYEVADYIAKNYSDYDIFTFFMSINRKVKPTHIVYIYSYNAAGVKYLHTKLVKA